MVPSPTKAGDTAGTIDWSRLGRPEKLMAQRGHSSGIHRSRRSGWQAAEWIVEASPA